MLAHRIFGIRSSIGRLTGGIVTESDMLEDEGGGSCCRAYDLRDGAGSPWARGGRAC